MQLPIDAYQVAVAAEGVALHLEAEEGQGVQLGVLFLQEVEGVVGVVAHHQVWRAMVVAVEVVAPVLTVSFQEPEEVVAVAVVQELAGSLLSPEEEVVAVVAVEVLPLMMLCEVAEVAEVVEAAVPLVQCHVLLAQPG